jgi:uncharacterized membrane protein YgcG
MKTSLLTITFVALLPSLSHAAEVIPPIPDRYFNDYADVVSEPTAHRFNEQLAQFERETSNQVVVAVFPKMQSDSDIADYTQRVAQAWGIGQRERRNGVVLFVFTQDRKMFLQVGYGLEGALPNATAFDITEYHIKPVFRNGNYESGLATGIDLICKAIRGEYTRSGKTLAEQRANTPTQPKLPKEVLTRTSLVAVILGIAVAVLIYFVPTIVGRHKTNAVAIFGVNFFLGWTFLGWVLALVWACTKDPVSENRFREPAYAVLSAVLGCVALILALLAVLFVFAAIRGVLNKAVPLDVRFGAVLICFVVAIVSGVLAAVCVRLMYKCIRAADRK